MKNFAPYVLGAALTMTSPNGEAAVHPSNATQASNQAAGPDYQKICEDQALIIMRELLPYIRLRVMTSLTEGLDSLEVKVQPDPNWPAQYVQNQVAYYLNGEKEVVELGKFSLNFPNPFLDYSLRYWKSGQYELGATCKYPFKK